MNGPQHYRMAEEMLTSSERIAYPDSGHTDEAAIVLMGLALRRAQVHATMALAAATADPYGSEEHWKAVLT